MRIGRWGAAADLAGVTRSKAFLVASVLLAAVALGATSASAAHSTAQKAWCASHLKMHQHLWAASICPAAKTVKKPAAMPKGQTNLRSLNREVAAAINKFRADHGLHKLRVSVKLNASSLQHSEEMGVDGYFDHDSADGTVWWKRIQKYYTTKNKTYWTVGENLLFASPDIGAADALQLWIESPEHLANLKNPNWRDLGVSAVHVVNAGGVYQGEDVTLITTDFGARH